MQVFCLKCSGTLLTIAELLLVLLVLAVLIDNVMVVEIGVLEFLSKRVLNDSYLLSANDHVTKNHIVKA